MVGWQERKEGRKEDEGILRKEDEGREEGRRTPWMVGGWI
jgi:hypothetical protein